MTYAYRWVVQQACQVTILVLVLVLAAAPVFGQAGDEGFIEYLRRQDPAAAERFVTLRNARDAALADYRQASERYSAGGPALRSVSLPALQQAKRRYAEASLALLDFLDERDRGLITKLEADIARVKRTLEERARDRTELQRMLRGE
jgi:hypothetical protein